MQRFADLLDEVATGSRQPSRRTRGWTRTSCHEQGVDAWAGPDSLPLWLPRPEYDGMLAHDADLPRAAGLRTRPVAESARDTLAWADATPDAVQTGIGRDRERRAPGGVAPR